MKLPAITTPKLLSALDNEASLWPLLVKDTVDNVGRSAMEFHRGGADAHHAGRERVIEEFSTMAVWIGGRKALNHALINPVIKGFGLDPAVDIMLFLKNKGQAVPRWIAARKNAYLGANVLRFIVGTLIPVGIIGWGIPTVNQAITRFMVAQERQQAALLYQPPGTLRFGAINAGKLLQQSAALINNELYGNVAIDLGISGGRLSKARNPIDAMEIAVRESSIILFLYFLGDYVKGHLKRYCDKTHGTLTQLTFNALNWLKGRHITPQQWSEETRLLQQLKPNTGFTKMAQLINSKTGRFDKNPLLELARHQGLLEVTRTPRGFALDSRKYVDLAKLKTTLAPLQKGLRTAAPRAYATLLNQTRHYKLVCMAAGYVISGVCLSWLSPMFQHWLTYKVTGKRDFPGTRQV